MSLEKEWTEISASIRANYPDRKVEQEDGKIEVNFSPSTFFIVKKDGYAEGSMPKHHFQTNSVDSIKVRDGITIVRGDDFEYLFKE